MKQDLLRIKWQSNRIPGHFLCAKLGCSRSHLCNVENGRAVLDAAEFMRFMSAIDELIEARKAMRRAGEEAGWPMATA